jgi:hypothetical protein
MLRHATTLGIIVFIAAACGKHAASSPRAQNEAASKASVAKRASVKAPTKEEELASLDEAMAETGPRPRMLGDFHVYEYSGAFTKKPVTLTEQVVAREGDNLVVDFVLEEGQSMTALRARMTDEGRVVAVSRIKDSGEEPASIADYEAMVKRTQVVPESNDSLVGTEHTSCMIGDEQVECDVTTYMVSIGGKEAKLTVSRSDKVPGRDVGGAITADDGTVLYSARLVERGNQPATVDAFAKAEKTEWVPEGL